MIGVFNFAGFLGYTVLYKTTMAVKVYQYRNISNSHHKAPFTGTDLHSLYLFRAQTFVIFIFRK